jgi:predicted MPP superfamily phosphohydrolase
MHGRVRGVQGLANVLDYWISVGIFHGGLLVLTWALARRCREPAAPGPWLLLLARQAAIWIIAALPLAGLASLLGYQSGFMVLRLLAEALFGELPVLALLAAAFALRRRGLRAVAGVPLAVAVALMAVYVEAYHREPTDLQVRRHVLDLTRGAPPAGTLRILHLTDLQADIIGPYEQQALRLAAAQPADLVLWTGDYVQPRIGGNRNRTEADLRAFLEATPFRAALGAYAVRGDVDRHWPLPLAGTGIQLLGGEAVRLPLRGGRFLSLAGLTPGMSRGKDLAPLAALVASLPATDLRIVFGHNPDFTIFLADRAPVELALAGHTHGGQVVLPLWGAPYTKSRLPRSLASGLGEYHGQPLHVSAGIGMERGCAPPVRFLCPPEICLLEVTY